MKAVAGVQRVQREDVDALGDVVHSLGYLSCKGICDPVSCQASLLAQTVACPGKNPTHAWSAMVMSP